MKDKEIIDAYCKIREINNTIPDDVLDFMKESSLLALKNQFIQPQSPTLLCIEESVIDEMIDNSSKTDHPAITASLGILKSKMKRIADVKSEAWDKCLKSVDANTFIEGGLHDEAIQQEKTKYINGE